MIDKKYIYLGGVFLILILIKFINPLLFKKFHLLIMIFIKKFLIEVKLQMLQLLILMKKV